MENAEDAASVIEKMVNDMRWVGPNGRPMAHIVLTRLQADLLLKFINSILNDRHSE